MICRRRLTTDHWQTQSATISYVVSRMVSVPSPRSGDTDHAGEAAEALRRILEAVDAGEIDVEAPRAKQLLRRLEGAVAAWETEGRSAS